MDRYTTTMNILFCPFLSLYNEHFIRIGADLVNGRDMCGVHPIIFAKS
jgi:hypothetical protein